MSETVVKYTASLSTVEAEKDVAICRRCGRKLKTEEARERGMGKICWMKSRTTETKKPLFTASKEDVVGGNH